jgi:hypothetical protein
VAAIRLRADGPATVRRSDSGPRFYEIFHVSMNMMKKKWHTPGFEPAAELPLNHYATSVM